MLTCLNDVVGYALLGSMGLCVYFHAICLDLCFHMPMCLDLCSLHALCHHLGACMLNALFVMPCAIVAILFILSYFLVF